MPIRPRKDKKTGEVIPDVYDLVVTLPRSPSNPTKRRRKSVVFHGSHERAQRELHRLERDAERRQLVPGRMTVGQLFDRYLEEHLKLRGAPNTYATYRMALTVHAQRLRAIPLTKLALHHLTAYEAYLRNEAVPRRGGRPGRGRLSPVSVERYMVPVRGALEWGEDVGLVERNPTRRWKAATAHPDERPVLSRDEVVRFMDAIAQSAWHLPLLVLLVTGMRLSELRGWRWEDIELDGPNVGTYRIRQQWQRIEGAWVHRPVTKSRSGMRSGGLPAPVVALLRRHRLAQADQRRFAKGWRDPEGGALVFADENGGPLDATRLREAFYRVMRKAQLPRLHLHDLRGVWVTLLLEAGEQPHVVSRLAGHASEHVTRLIYSHAQRGAGIAAAERLWGYIHAVDVESGP